MKKIFLIISVFYLTLTPLYVNAAVFFFDPLEKSAKEGDKFTMSLQLKPGEDLVNAVEGSVKFDSDILEVSSMGYDNSIVNIWIEKPVLKDGKIIFSGIIPGGFNGVLRPLDKNVYPGTLFSINFEVVGSGETAVSIENILALQNDGLGTQVESSIVPSLVRVKNSNPTQSLGLLLLLFVAIIIGTTAYLKKIKQ